MGKFFPFSTFPCVVAPRPTAGTPFSEQGDFAKYSDQPNKMLHRTTGELAWDYGRATIPVQPPKTQAVPGKTAGRTFKLPGVTATFKTPSDGGQGS